MAKQLTNKEKQNVYKAINGYRKRAYAGEEGYNYVGGMNDASIKMADVSYSPAESKPRTNLEQLAAQRIALKNNAISAYNDQKKNVLNSAMKAERSQFYNPKKSVDYVQPSVMKSKQKNEALANKLNQKIKNGWRDNTLLKNAVPVQNGKFDVSKLDNQPKASMSESKYTIESKLGNTTLKDTKESAYNHGYEDITPYDRKLHTDRMRDYNKAAMDERMKSEEEYASKHPVVGAASSVASGFLGSALTPIGVARDRVLNPLGEIDANKPIYKMTRASSAQREGTKTGTKATLGIKDFDENGNHTFSSQAVDFGVDTGLSMVDTVVRSAFTPLGGAVQAGLSAGSQAFLDAKDSGADDKHAIAQGIAQGVAEEFFEKFSLEGLQSFKTAPADSIKAILKNIGKQTITEGSEEMFTDWANAVTDYMIMGGDSQWQQDYDAYIANGYTDKQAVMQATANVLKQSALSFLGGAISGGLLGSGAQAVNYRGNVRTGEYLAQNNQDFTSEELRQTAEAIIDDKNILQSDEALEQAQSTKEYLEGLADKLDSGEALTPAEKGTALNEIINTANNAEDIDTSKIDNVNEGFIDEPTQEFSESDVDAYINELIKKGNRENIDKMEAKKASTVNNDSDTVVAGPEEYKMADIGKADKHQAKGFDAYVNARKELERRSEKRFESNENAKKAYVDFYNGQNIVDYDENMSKAYTAGRSGKSLASFDGDSAFSSYYGKHPDSIDAMWNIGYSDYSNTQKAVVEGGISNGKNELGEVSDLGAVQPVNEVRAGSDNGHGGLRTEENTEAQGGRKTVRVPEEQRGTDVGSLGERDRSGASGGRSGRVSEGDEVLSNESRSRGGRGRVSETTPNTVEVGSDIEYNGTQYEVESLKGDKVVLKEKNSESDMFPNGKHAEVFKSDIEDEITSSNSETAETKKAEKPKKKEKVKKAETAKEQAKQKEDIVSQPQPKGTNYIIPSDTSDIPTTESTRYTANVNAIKTLKNIISEERIATPAEQDILAKYTGWGGISNAKWQSSEAELKEILSEGEFATASRSLLDAYYTDPSIIRSIYAGLEHIGFKGGKMLEPSAGVGRFIGAMPSKMLPSVNSWTAVELDSITGNIAKYLYPNADIRVQGFQDAKIINNYMDVVVGNVPFGDFGVSDKRYPKSVTSLIHNYFIARSLDTLREGGVACLITSSGTMDSRGTDAREFFMKKADLIGAIRLPNTAFKGTGTTVTTDILVFKKRAADTPYTGEAFLNGNESYPSRNEYFVKHPEMMLGKPEYTSGRYGSTITYNPLDTDVSLEKQIENAFSKITTKMEYPKVDMHRSAQEAINAARNNKEGTAYKRDGKIFINNQGKEQAIKLDDESTAIYSEVIDIRDTARALIDAMSLGKSDKDISNLRKRLNEQYDAFKKKYKLGFHTSAVKNVLKSDTDYAFIEALEKTRKVDVASGNGKVKKKTEVLKGDIFFKNTINPAVNITTVDTIENGIEVSLNELGYIDTKRVAELMHISTDELEKRLTSGDAAFKDVDGNWVSADTYLSGNVRAKLKEAEALADGNAEYKKNVEALKKVVPADIKGPDINVNVGVTWIPTEYYAQFAAELFGINASNVTVNYIPNVGYTAQLSGNMWGVTRSAENMQIWGSKYMPFFYRNNNYPGMFNLLLNGKDVTIKHTDADGNKTIDNAATEELRELKNKINDKFNSWLWEDSDRRELLENVYNDSFNCMVRPKYASDVSIAGQAADIKLREHQGRAINRIARSPYNTLLQHGAGAGKTYAMIGAVMKLKQLGIAKKPAIIVPKNKISDWRNDFFKMFPSAKVLVADDTTFSTTNRKVFINQVATSDIDAVIMSKEQFKTIPMTLEYQQQFYQSQIDACVAAINESEKSGGKKNVTVRQIEKRKSALETKLKNLEGKKDYDNAYFEETGIDYIFADEAQAYKNLMYTSSRQNVADMGSSDGNQITFDMLMKANYMRSKQNGKGIVFGTATPVMNSPVEAYTMLKYLANEELEKRGIKNLDNFIDMFGKIEAQTRQDAVGRKWTTRNAFSGFINMNEWQQLWGMITDVVKTQDVPGIVLPKMKGGDRNVIVCEAGPKAREVIEGLSDRLKKNDKKGENHVFALQSDGKKASFTQRFFDASLPYGDNEKVPVAVNEIFKIWEDSKTFIDRDGNTQENGVQLVFCDLGVPTKPKASNKNTESENDEDNNPNVELYDEKVQVYNDMKNMLIAKGVPANEIAFIHDAKDDTQREELYDKVRSGKVRVLIGSSKKMGEGLNVQDRIVALHEMNPLARPGDIEQVEARAIRQGNMSPEVAVNVYVTKDTFDTKQWDNLRNKAKFIGDITSGEYTGRDANYSSDEFGASAADIMAVSSGNPLLKEQVEINEKLRKLENLEKAHTRKIYDARVELDKSKKEIARNEALLPKFDADAKAVRDISGDKFVGRINKKTLTKRKEFGEEVIATSKKAIASSNDEPVKVGSIGGLDLYVSGKVPAVELRGEAIYNAEINYSSAEGTVTRIANTLAAIKDKASIAKASIKDREANIPKLEEVIASKFDKADELKTVRKEAENIEKQLLQSGKETNTGSESEVLARKTNYSHYANIEEYTEHQKENWKDSKKIIVYENDNQALDFINNSLSDATYDKKLYFGKISETLADRVYNETGVEIEGFNCAITSFEVRKIINNSHGDFDRESPRGQRVIKKEDILLIPQIINDPDKIVLSSKMYGGKPVIEFEKTIDGRTTVVSYVSTKHKDLFVQTMYGGNKKRSLATSLSGDNSFSHTSETPRSTASFTDNVTLDRKKDKPKVEPRPLEWETERTEGNTAEVKTLSEIIGKMQHKYGFNLTIGHIRGNDKLGEFNTRDKGIKTKIADDLPTITHEFGHWFDDKFGLSEDKNIPNEAKEDFKRALGLENAALYDPKLHAKEGAAEFMRAYLKNKDTAAIDYPDATKYLMQKLSPKELAELSNLADEINAYFSADASVKGSPVLKENSKLDFRTPMEKLKDTSGHWYQLWVDSNHSFRRLDRETGGDTYLYATNAAYSDARAYQMLLGDIRDIEGNYVAPGLKTALSDIDITSGLNGKPTQEYIDFGEYLVMRHGIEFLKNGKRVFADDSMNSESYMSKRANELERMYPKFRKAADRLYDFIDNFTMTYAVGEGLITRDDYDAMKQLYPCYVPFFRAGFKNRGNALARAKGSGRPIIHPVDNVVDMVIKMTNTATRNNTLKHLRDDALKLGADATFIEKIPAPLIPKEFDMSGIKADLADKSLDILSKNFADGDLIDEMQTLIDNVTDTLVQFEVGKAKGNVIQILVDGKREFWKVNDPDLLDSITSMNARVQNGVIKAYAKTTRFMTSNITGRNVIWSIFSNSVRDLQTAAIYTKKGELGHLLGGIGSNFINSLMHEAGKDVSPLYSEYLSMGGGSAGVWQGSDNFTPNMRKAIGNKRVSINPFHWLTWLSDTIEMGPRFATYAMLRKQGESQQKAFYEAMDSTVNFRRHGVYSKEANAAVQFFNASVQGIDKANRFFLAEDLKGGKYTKEQRAKAVLTRLAMITAISAITAVLQHVLKDKDDEDKKAYELLSNYTKNSYFVLPLGNGKFFAIPKPRELGTLSSIISRTLEYSLDDNEFAFDDFYSYWAQNGLPSIVADFAEVPFRAADEGLQPAIDELVAGIVGSVGVLGIAANVMANRDFLGRPIESNSYKELMPKDRYNENTSQMAYLIGQALNLSPQKIDYFGKNFFGVLWKTPQALFPIDDGNGVKGTRDMSLGVANTYVKDSLYSQDLVNWLYDEKDKSEALKNHDEGDIDSKIAYTMENALATYYSRFNKLNKVNFTNSQRLSRWQILEVIKAYKESKTQGVYATSELKFLTDIAKQTGDTSVLPSTMDTKVKDADGNEYTLTDIQYVDYQNSYNDYFYKYLGYLNKDKSAEVQADAIAKCKEYAKWSATNDTLKKFKAKGKDKKKTITEAINDVYAK